MRELMKIGEVVLGRYEVTDLIDEGGQASVAKGLDRKTGRLVAIKRLEAMPGQPNYAVELARFQRAGRLQIGHPAVVDPIDCGEENGAWYMVMPFIEGLNLDQHVANHGGRLTPDEAVAIITQVAGGLTAMHRHGVVHRDLKPPNIRIDRQGHVHILDLGICRKLSEATVTQDPGLLGSLQWMSPEQLRNPGNEDPRSDLYSLGGIFYYMLTGSPPVQGNDPGAVALSICQWVPPPPHQIVPDIPAQVSSACMKLLAKRPEDRLSDAEAFLLALAGQTPVTVGCDFCPSCGARAAADARYCRECGAGLRSSWTAPARCLACGAEAGEAPTCGRCGRPFATDHRLLFVAGPLTGHTFRIPQGNYTVGRDELAARDQHLSRRHFHVICVDGHVSVADAGSTNKTYVAGQLADRAIPLLHGLELSVAGNRARYTCGQERS